MTFVCVSDSSFVCDRQENCPDGSDEAKCCKEGEFQCVGSGRCIDQLSVCDGINTCEDNSDENPSACNIASIPYADKSNFNA